MLNNIKNIFDRRGPAPIGAVEFIVVGLGNPGSRYTDTRHNTGFMALDKIAENRGVKIDKIRFKSLVGEGMLEGKRVLLMKPSTFMNLSGQAVQAALSYYKLQSENLVVIYDDISLAPGRLRIRLKGSDGGHNGIKNIIYLLGSDSFPRIKIGVGDRTHPDFDMKDWVLSRFSSEEKKQVDEAVIRADSALSLILSGHVTDAMNKFNG